MPCGRIPRHDMSRRNGHVEDNRALEKEWEESTVWGREGGNYHFSLSNSPHSPVQTPARPRKCAPRVAGAVIIMMIGESDYF